eukprot:TRINITY_DN36368_c0_g1_i1.p1 TRINITY_DN36368_c0_g1~~TRINITY_DN36368_c0_g1_i1.p1  ORF type:complete len:171 (-),score=4.97 TRINITY_DN36368_c0_g1_i1:298-810(-)
MLFKQNLFTRNILQQIQFFLNITMWAGVPSEPLCLHTQSLATAQFNQNKSNIWKFAKKIILLKKIICLRNFVKKQTFCNKYSFFQRNIFSKTKCFRNLCLDKKCIKIYNLLNFKPLQQWLHFSCKQIFKISNPTQNFATYDWTTNFFKVRNQFKNKQILLVCFYVKYVTF